MTNDNRLAQVRQTAAATRMKLRYTYQTEMAKLELAEEIIAVYRKHGWQLRSVLLKPETRASIGGEEILSSTRIQESEIDALWFSRPSPAGREAWELRLIAEQQYALFEAFEPKVSGEELEKARREMETRMREHVAGN